ncbi:RsmB/NOP family class I SAM-dependent RNA methyltransferase [Fusibacter sp. Q10-2]|uniref:RsmB/NOP family class I SAM-dependent RNA methyltransferase n=2 Tax=Fusibacter ferrireducens TaxID=2785058 RepID=A0ABR9ZZT8_9FIRM|nr:RsmB/NOP family class I SAM-dependent RNA methyltransferase [Fusibacter ferrireducens]
MKIKLGTEFEAFLASYDTPVYTGLRVNTLKISVEDFLEIFPYPLEPIEWTEDGFYYREEDPVTKHPLFYAGLYYIQEPSAMSPVTVLNPQSGDKILDLCAAPGGKSLQIASFTKDSGLLVTNDINDKRVKAIVRNVEKYGVKNVLILNDDQHTIARVLPHYFDRILIDAPCSGEGMFKKDSKAVKAWASYANETCAKMQREILEVVPDLVKENTELVYSTCTFSEVENEAQMLYLEALDAGFKKQYVTSDFFDVKNGVAHLWPHLIKGEGHFIGSMIYQNGACNEAVGIGNNDQCVERKNSRHFVKPQRQDEKKGSNRVKKDRNARAEIVNEMPTVLKSFSEQYLNQVLSGTFMIEREKIYLLPEQEVDIKGLHVARYGWLLGEIKRDKFVPSQAFAMGLCMADFKNVANLPASSVQVLKFLKGETLDYDEVNAYGTLTKGFCLFCTEGYPLGFIKVEQGLIKNLYPISWRMM